MQLCEAAYGDFNRYGYPTTRICKRNVHHPSYDKDGIGHSTFPDKESKMKISRIDPLPKELDIEIILSPEEAKMLRAMAMASQPHQNSVVQIYSGMYSDQLGYNALENFLIALKQGLYNEGI